MKRSSPHDPTFSDEAAPRPVRRVRRAPRPTTREAIESDYPPIAPAPPLDHAAIEAASAAAKARHKRRRARKRGGLLMLAVSGTLSLVLMAMIQSVHADYRWMKAQADAKQARLTLLVSKRDIAQRQLSALRSDKGRDQLLIEHGFLPPGERVLLFPPTRNAAQVVPDDNESAATSATPPAASSSVWHRAQDTLRGWWNAVRTRIEK